MINRLQIHRWVQWNLPPMRTANECKEHRTIQLLFKPTILRKRGIKHNVLNAKLHQREADIVAEAGIKSAVTIATNMAGRGTDIKLSQEVKDAGGLAIIGTERHESRRIDNQLRGRSGRQGDIGSSQFFLSLDDKLLRLFGGDQILDILKIHSISVNGKILNFGFINLYLVSTYHSSNKRHHCHEACRNGGHNSGTDCRVSITTIVIWFFLR